VKVFFEVVMCLVNTNPASLHEDLSMHYPCY